MPENQDTIIAERTWTYHVSPTEQIPVPVRFTKPRRSERDGFWECRFLISWPDGNVIERKGFGPDSVDALLTVIAIFKIECEKLKEALGSKITFESSSSLSGFEVTD